MRAALDYVVGLLLTAVLAGGLAWGMSEPEEGLHAELVSSGPYLVAPAARPIDVGPPSLLGRVHEEEWGSDALGLTTYRVNYGNRWLRDITAPTLRGPLDEEGASWCGIAARISPGVLDPKQSGDGLLELVRVELGKVLPMTLPCGFTTNVHLSKPKTVSLKMTPRAGAIDIEALADLADGTQVGAASVIRLVADEDGHLAVDHVGPVQPLFAGPGRAQCEGTLKVQLGNLWWKYIKGQRGSLVLATARAEMTRRITPALGALNTSLSGLHEPFQPIAGQGHQVQLRLARPPEVGPDGIALRLCARVHVAGARVDPAITGPPLVRSEPPPMPPAASGARIDVNLDAEALNRVVYVLWQIGELRRWGTSTEILAQLPDDVRALAFEVTGFDPRLPPVLDGDRLTAANIAIGRWGKKQVMGHATGGIRLTNAGSRVVMTAAVDRMAVSCVEPRGQGGWHFTPCLSELLPLVGDRVRADPPRLTVDTAPIVQAIAGHTLHGLRLDLSPPRVKLLKGMLSAQLSVKVGAASPRPSP